MVVIMGLLNIIWILIFFYFGFRLTFQGFDRINFGAWDNIMGIVMIAVAIFGIYCLVKSTTTSLAPFRRKIYALKKRLSAGKDKKQPENNKQNSSSAEKEELRNNPLEEEDKIYSPEADIHSIDLESIITGSKDSPEDAGDTDLEELLK